jgi:hypothetical protein
VRPARVELATFWFVAKRSIQLSYGRPECKCGPNRLRHTEVEFNSLRERLFGRAIHFSAVARTANVRNRAEFTHN